MGDLVIITCNECGLDHVFYKEAYHRSELYCDDCEHILDEDDAKLYVCID